MPTARKQLVLVNGDISEMPDGDYPFASVNSSWPLLASGYWHDLPNTGNIAGVAMTSGRQYCHPFIVPVPCELRGIGVRTTTAATGSTARLGVLLGDNTDGLPLSLIDEFGTVSTAAVASTALTTGIAVPLNPGQLYFATAAIQGGTPTMQAGSSKDPLVQDMNATSPQFAVRTSYYYSSVTGALPTTYGTPAATAQGPCFGLRFVVT